MFIINGTIELYINGVNVSNDSFVLSGNSIGLTNGDKFIGNNASDRYLIGNMDNLFLWGKTLSQQEILDYMSCPPNSDEQDLVSYWSFEDGSGSVVLDQTLNGNNGSLVNNALGILIFHFNLVNYIMSTVVIVQLP